MAEQPHQPPQSVRTEQLVARGLYRYVRNPMYLAVLAVITGQALLLSRPVGRTRLVAPPAAGPPDTPPLTGLGASAQDLYVDGE